MDSKNVPIIFIGALLLVPLFFLAYYACRIMRQSKEVLKDEVQLNYVELLKRDEINCDDETKPNTSSSSSNSTSSSQFTFPFYKQGRSEKCVYVREAKKLDFTEREDLVNEVCVICTENFTNNCCVVVLACGHDYHEECFRDWIIDKLISSCPLCQQQVHAKTVLKWKWRVT